MDFEPHDKKLNFDSPDKINTDELETFEFEYAGKEENIEIIVHEFTSVCPYSGLPDFAKIYINYTPDKLCLELRALKYYLLSYRNVGIFYEHLIPRALEDLVKCCSPKKMTVRGEFTIRGGLQSIITASHPE